MGFKLRSGSQTKKLSAWDKFKADKANKPSSDFDDDFGPQKAKPKGPKTNDVGDSDLDSDWGGSTSGTGAKAPKPKSKGSPPAAPPKGKGIPADAKPTLPSNGFGGATTQVWNDKSFHGPNGRLNPLEAGLTGTAVIGPEFFSGKGPASPAVHDLLGPDGKSKFGIISGDGISKLNPKYFEPVDGGPAFKIRDGVKPSDAIKDLIASKPGSYELDPNTAFGVFSMVSAYRHHQAKYGDAADAKFDKHFAGMQIGGPGSDPSQAFWGKAEADGPIHKGKPRFRKGDDLYFLHPSGLVGKNDLPQQDLGK